MIGECKKKFYHPCTAPSVLRQNRGYAIGSEFKGKGVNIALGPVAGPIGRIPAGGRNWVIFPNQVVRGTKLTNTQEGFSPDPWLTGIGMFETVQGMQDAGVVATAKHLVGWLYSTNLQRSFTQLTIYRGAGNEEERFRKSDEAIGYGFNITESISSNIDDRTMHGWVLRVLARL